MRTKLTRRGEWAQKIDYKEAEQMLRAGKTQSEVAARFDVTQGAVSNAITRGNINIDTGRTNRRDIPWHPIRPEHRDKYLVRMLRVAARRDQGLKSTPVLEAMLDKFLEKAEAGGWVVTYDPENYPDEGFVRVPRRVGVDTWLVRDPSVDGHGQPTERTA